MVKQGKWFSALFFYLFFYQTAAFRLNRRKDLSTVKTRLTLKAQQSVCFFSSPSLELFFLFAHLHEQMALLPKGIGIGGGGGGWGEVVVGRGGGLRYLSAKGSSERVRSTNPNASPGDK